MGRLPPPPFIVGDWDWVPSSTWPIEKKEGGWGLANSAELYCIYSTPTYLYLNNYCRQKRGGMVFVLSTKQASLYGKALSHFPQWKKPQRGSMFPARTVHRGPQWQKERVEKGRRYDGESARSEAIIIPSPSSFPSKRTTKRREGGERRKEPISHLFPLLSPSPLLLLFPGSSFFPHWGNFSSTASSVFLCCYTPPDAAEKEGEKKIGDGEGRGGSKRMDGRGRQ